MIKVSTDFQVSFIHLFIYFHANPLKAEVQALHSDLLLLAVPILSLLAHVLPVILCAPEPLLETAVNYLTEPVELVSCQSSSYETLFFVF